VVWALALGGLFLSIAAFVLGALFARAGRGAREGRHRDVGALTAAAAHAANEGELKALVNSARVLMWLADVDGRRTHLNRSWLEFTGRAMEDELGNGWTAGVHGDDARRLAAGTDLAREGRAYEAEYRLRRFDGEYRWMLERGEPRVGPAGALLGFVGSCVDVSERKLREAALHEERAQLERKVEERTQELGRANAELARAARLKDEFLANVSHELRTPLTAVLGLSESLLEPGAAPLSDKQRKSLRTIEESGQHLLSLINELLDLARIEAGQMRIDAKAGVSVERVCQGSLRFVKEAAQKKGVSLSLQMHASAVTMECDERRLKQALVNLLGNAVKFTPEGGSVGLEVAGDPAENVLRFTVWDTGIGIRRDDMGRLFQPFVQVDGSLTRRHGGTGLGLALSRRMVELQGGRVLAGSEPGKGSRFTIVLPWRGNDPAPASPAAAGPEATADVPASAPSRDEPVEACRLLLVEDNADLAAMLADHLRGAGHQVLCARSGAGGLEAAVQERPEVIVMDVEMPDMDGLEAIRRIRAEPGLENTPILALTALAMPGDRERCLAAGATDYLSKPLNLKSLSAWVGRCRRSA
jgi:PAS domain S-box-containing protein